jgi:NitT/TauT family transport system substrate-binding protein
MKNTFAVVIIIIALLAGTGIGYYIGFESGKTEGKLDPVIVAMSWTAGGNEAIIFNAGKELGFYEENGIQILINRGYGSSDTATKVDAGVAHFGYVAFDSLVKMIGQGADIKALALTSKKSGGSIITLEEKGVEKPADLYDLVLSSSPGSSGGALWPAFISITGLDPERFALQSHSSGVEFAIMVSKQVDGVITSSMGAEVIKAQGQPVNIMMMYDYGLTIPGYTIVTSNKMIDEQPDLVKRFVQATAKSLEYVLENEDEALDILVKHNPELDKEVEIHRWRHILEIHDTDGIYPFDREVVQKGIDLIQQYLGLEVDVNPDDIYTNEFMT